MIVATSLIYMWGSISLLGFWDVDSSVVFVESSVWYHVHLFDIDFICSLDKGYACAISIVLTKVRDHPLSISFCFRPFDWHVNTVLSHTISSGWACWQPLTSSLSSVTNRSNFLPICWTRWLNLNCENALFDLGVIFPWIFHTIY